MDLFLNHLTYKSQHFFFVYITKTQHLHLSQINVKQLLSEKEVVYKMDFKKREGGGMNTGI